MLDSDPILVPRGAEGPTPIVRDNLAGVLAPSSVPGSTSREGCFSTFQFSPGVIAVLPPIPRCVTGKTPCAMLIGVFLPESIG